MEDGYEHYYGSEDCGFEEPDVRWEGYTSEGERVEVKIFRDYYAGLDEELEYHCTFDILKDGVYYMRDIPSEDKAIKVAKIIFDIKKGAD